MTPEQATNLIFEMLDFAAKRGAYSSIEIKAISSAIEVIKSQPGPANENTKPLE